MTRQQDDARREQRNARQTALRLAAQAKEQFALAAQGDAFAIQEAQSLIAKAGAWLVASLPSLPKGKKGEVS
jgi:hypothetical protein